MNSNLSPAAEGHVRRLGLHLGLMARLVQTGSPLSLVQQQATALRAVLRGVLDLDEPSAAYVRLDYLLPPEVADAIAEPWEVPDTPEGLL